MALQLGCLVFLVADATMDIAVSGAAGEDLPHSVLEMAVVLALMSGVVLIGYQLRITISRMHAAQRQVRIASGALHELLEEHFDDWGLTPAEREVALFSIKGLSNSEIAALRGTRDGTVKAQLNAIYAKAGVSGRPQLLGLFIEELMAGPLPGVSGNEGRPTH
ncbi:helix-turn-helix transcriptional regulator [Limibaculum sp. M0105]|uniref:Helix-turn-helix transcriptional regulator n=1 Tax=Thermohalobaculum xanthum TaxID=2753746 RepID=A0A8J7M832_9RHOB|nr:helix-turn-helix transcriptional regulator [Thermohalobaculum xanthum]MBK0400041.1 helix-turn-helix transcriptional regulator [Thermohalobaculum xanthum]